MVAIPRLRAASRTASAPLAMTAEEGRRLWLRAQRLDEAEPFGSGPTATQRAIEHLGYVQIDTIHVIERCHHHILWGRIPAYRRADLAQAQTVEKSVFEYWTHALSYVPSRDYRFFMAAMKRHGETPSNWFASVTSADLKRVLALIRRDGALSIRDIEDEVLVEKDHAWASRKPSKRVLQMAFFAGRLTVSQRAGMLKTYELSERHFGWERRPRAASEREINDYLLDRALRSQGLVSLDSICHLDAGRKPAMRAAIEARVARRRLRPVALEEAGRTEHWVEPQALDAPTQVGQPRVHILSPFDPLIIQRKRLKLFFGHDHRFEAYVPKEKRVFGYFALPVLDGDRIVAAIDLKADRERDRLVIQQWTPFGDGATPTVKARIEAELERFERFQLRRDEPPVLACDIEPRDQAAL